MSRSERRVGFVLFLLSLTPCLSGLLEFQANRPPIHNSILSLVFRSATATSQEITNLVSKAHYHKLVP
jgi:hypothetical protein